MSGLTIALIVIVVIVVILAIALIAMYNNLVRMRNRVDNAWAQVNVQLQRRLDLIPNLVETVKGYASHESGTLQAVTEARTAAMAATTPEARAEAENMLTGALKTLFAVSEAYPDLKASANFLDLQAQLSETEDKISYMRQSYNDTVMKYNNGIQTFPAVIFAGMFGFKERELFEADAAASTAPQVSFSRHETRQNCPGAFCLVVDRRVCNLACRMHVRRARERSCLQEPRVHERHYQRDGRHRRLPACHRRTHVLVRGPLHAYRRRARPATRWRGHRQRRLCHR